MQSNLSIKIVETVRKASRLLIRDFYEVDKLKYSNNILQFVDTSYSRTDKLLKREFGNLMFKTLLPENSSWLIIPIEGKVNFLHGIPYFCVLVTLFVDDEPIITVIDSPIFKETCSVEKGMGVILQDMSSVFKLRVSKNANLKQACVCSNHIMDIGIGYFRCFGSNFLNLLYVASGKMDAFIFKTKEDNIAQILSTFSLVMAESKGKISVKNDFVIVSNFELHQDICNKVQKYINNM